MLKKFARLTAGILLSAMIIAPAAGCSASRPIKSTREELSVVGKVGTFDVLYEELRYLTLNYMDQLKNSYGENIWDSAESAEPHRAELEAMVYNNITANYATLSVCRDFLIEADDKTIAAAVNEYVDDLVEELGGRREYKNNLAENHMTDHLFRFLLSTAYLRKELYYVHVEDTGLIEKDSEKIKKKILDGECVRTLHVYISNDPGDDIEENRKSAEDVRERLLAGTDIKTIIGSSVNEDYMTTTAIGYYFFRGEMLKGYEEAAFSLEIGDVSEVVETAGGFFVIQRLKLDSAYVDQNLGKLVENYQYAALDLIIEARRDTLTFELNDTGRAIDLLKIK